MARKKRQRISYVLPLANSPGGHRLGVNGLAIDQDRSILFTGGRDGVICSWNVDSGPSQNTNNSSSSTSRGLSTQSKGQDGQPTTFRSQVQAHTHWVNDIILAHNNSALVSASSDVTVKVWRPQAEYENNAKTIGAHSDYVKCLASPSANADWVASGGLDHKISLWDLSGAGQKLEIVVSKKEDVTKGSVYALCAKDSTIASGGPESVIRLWDARSGSSITKLVGHTDNVRSILMSDDGSILMTGSSDQTVKVWSLAAGRCLHTLTMHNDSVWSLSSNHPQLSVFYSSDRSGLVAKTDTRGGTDLDEGVSIALCQEHEGVSKVIAAANDVWTATSSSSVNRWKDIETALPIEQPPSTPHSRTASTVSNSDESAPLPRTDARAMVNGSKAESQIPFTAVLRLAMTTSLASKKGRNREHSVISDSMLDGEPQIMLPVRDAPHETVHGQNGLIKHVMLNDRKRVLTLDTAGEVVLWDLIKCIPIRTFNGCALDDVVSEVNTTESIANWCAVDTRTGELSISLEDNNCFDAEVYADEVDIPGQLDFREDQRINLGKWVLRNLFAALVDEEIKRDEIYRRSFRQSTKSTTFHRSNAPPSITLPLTSQHLSPTSSEPTSNATYRQQNGPVPMTPGMSIGVATPGISTLIHNTLQTGHLTPTTEEGPGGDRRLSPSALKTGMGDRTSDYFSSNPNSHQSETSSESNKAPATPGEVPAGQTPASPTDDKEEKKKSSLFGKNFKMTFPKNIKLGRSSTEAKPSMPSEDKPEDMSDKSSEHGEKVFEESFLGVVQRIRHDYDEQIRADADLALGSGIMPPLPNEAPLLGYPQDTMLIIQEDNPESGGVADVYRGAIGSFGEDADAIEKAAPAWLGELLLKNHIPYKDTAKVSFILQPYRDILPSIASPDGNARLNANRMLRAKKILAYVAERIEAPAEHSTPQVLKPEDYLDLYCHDQLVHPNTTLATLRVHIWRTGGDVVLYYRANGRKEISLASTVPSAPTSAVLPVSETPSKAVSTATS